MRTKLLSFVLILLSVCTSVSVAFAAKSVEGVVNLNTAKPEELQLLPGIGPAKVKAIIEYRQKRPFRTVEELVRIKGIGRKMLTHLRAHLTVTGETTAHAAASKPAPAPPTSTSAE